jgi:hypothetical protein
MKKVIGNCVIKPIYDDVEITRAESPLGKPFLRLEFPGGVSIPISTNLAEMIGGVGAGVRKRWEDLQK